MTVTLVVGREWQGDSPTCTKNNLRPLKDICCPASRIIIVPDPNADLDIDLELGLDLEFTLIYGPWKCFHVKHIR